HVLERDAGAALRDVVPVAALVVGERERRGLALRGLERLHEGRGGARHRRARVVVDLCAHRPRHGGQHRRDGRSVQELSPAEGTHGSQCYTPLTLSSPGMRILLLAVLALVAPAAAVADDAVRGLLRGGAQGVLMRRTITTPGVGDPAGFRLDDCATQRNLTDARREDARRVGPAFREHAIPVGRVLSSPWCRCLETSRLAFGGAEVWAPLSNLFDNRARE